MTARALIFLLLSGSLALSADTPRIPTINDLLMVKSVGAAQISPNGKYVAYVVSETDFKQDAFVTQIWIADTGAGTSRQLTQGEKGASSPQWSPDGTWLAFTSARVGDKNQIFIIHPDGGEAVQLTKSETGVSGFAWSENGTKIAYTATDAASQHMKDRKEYYDDYEVVREEYNYTHLWIVNLAEALRAATAGNQHTHGTAFTVGSFSWSPDGTKIAFGATVNPDLTQGNTADIYVLNLADDAVKKIVSSPGPDNSPHWSPDGRQIVFSSAMGNAKQFAQNTRLAVVPAEGGTPRSITDGFDENPGFVAWNAGGIFFSGAQKTASHLFRVDPATGNISRITVPDSLIGSAFSITRDGKRMGLVIASPSALGEVMVSDVQNFAPRRLTNMTDQAKDFILGTREVISWKSRDGAAIEGILIKPANFDPARKYPLLCIIHGGPTGVDRPVLLTPDTRYYPADIWAGRGALILKVNYRGSSGYGEKFRMLNVRNLGVGDSWDVISGVDYLIGKGWVDPSKVACMGWSEGGYISAFLTTSSDRFAAISVGAGISDWATYYYNTDITDFTLNYLGADPVEDPAIYEKTSPMSYIKNARTPTLIQHGELDKRVPTPNGYELRLGLLNRGVKVEMVVYKGYGHGITKPKSIRAVMQHNLSWFNHYLWGDPMPDFAKPEVPAKESSK
jgi:dipeptidyl aminopeptidase/acylaminoacyl peptidase